MLETALSYFSLLKMTSSTVTLESLCSESLLNLAKAIPLLIHTGIFNFNCLESSCLKTIYFRNLGAKAKGFDCEMRIRVKVFFSLF